MIRGVLETNGIRALQAADQQLVQSRLFGVN